jgi:hypothetical protein
MSHCNHEEMLGVESVEQSVRKPPYKYAAQPLRERMADSGIPDQRAGRTLYL